MILGLATAAGACISPTVASGHFVQSSYTFGANGCTVEQRSDPVNMIFYGSRATAALTNFTVQISAGWTSGTGSDQWLQSHGDCYHFHYQTASGLLTRYHIRMWQMPGLDLKNRYITYGAVHHEDFVVGNGCGIPGSHAVDADGPQGSGFDQGRQRLGQYLGDAGFVLGEIDWWQNIQSFRQCDGDNARSDGFVFWYRLGSG